MGEWERRVGKIEVKMDLGSREIEEEEEEEEEELGGPGAGGDYIPTLPYLTLYLSGRYTVAEDLSPDRHVAQDGPSLPTAGLTRMAPLSSGTVVWRRLHEGYLLLLYYFLFLLGDP
jgi:hypothetical protein